MTTKTKKASKCKHRVNITIPCQLSAEILMAIRQLKENPALLRDVLHPKAKLTVLLELLNMDHDYCPTLAEHRVIADLLYYAKETGNEELTNLLHAQQAMMNNQALPVGTVLADIGICDDH